MTDEQQMQVLLVSWWVPTVTLFCLVMWLLNKIYRHYKLIQQIDAFDGPPIHPLLGNLPDLRASPEGKKWHTRRKILTPAFHFTILENFVEIFNEKSKVLVERFAEKADGKPFDIFNTVTLCVLDIIMETAMGLNIDIQRNGDMPYVQAVKRVSSIVQKRQTSPWLYKDWMFQLFGPGKEHDSCIKLMHEKSLSAIRDRRRKHEKEKTLARQDNTAPSDMFLGYKKKLPFLDILLHSTDDEGKALTDEDIREEVDTFMFEGHDTTASSINMTLYLLGKHPDIQEDVSRELEDVLGDCSYISSHHIKELKLLERCIKEALRLYPSVPMFGRESPPGFTLDNKKVPTGTQILVVPYLLHKDPEQFPDPARFDPSRFLPEVIAQRHPFAYVPFSAGPRNCIGQKFAMMEEKVVLASVLRHYQIESITTDETLNICGELVLRPKNGLIVKMRKRQLAR